MRFVCADGEEQYRDAIVGECSRRLREAGHELVWFDAPLDDVDDWVRRAEGADGILLIWSLPSGTLARCPSIRVVSFTGTGVQRYVDMEEAAAHGVLVCNVPSYAANAVAEHTFALIFAASRRIAAGDRLLRAGQWQQAQGLELRGRRLGVVGAGPIAARVIEIGKALGMKPAFWTRAPCPEREKRLGARFVELRELFTTSDVVSINLAHTRETEGLVGEELLRLLPQHAVVVNTARAEIVDNCALARLLDAGAIFGVGLDVFDPEPPPPESPLLRSDRVVVSPHVANQTPEALIELFDAAIENLLAFAGGTPRNVTT
jgi:phosphoglycerate dehydrogenase-like enzyme